MLRNPFSVRRIHYRKCQGLDPILQAEDTKTRCGGRKEMEGVLTNPALLCRRKGMERIEHMATIAENDEENAHVVCHPHEHRPETLDWEAPIPESDMGEEMNPPHHCLHSLPIFPLQTLRIPERNLQEMMEETGNHGILIWTERLERAKDAENMRGERDAGPVETISVGFPRREKSTLDTGRLGKSGKRHRMLA